MSHVLDPNLSGPYHETDLEVLAEQLAYDLTEVTRNFQASAQVLATLTYTYIANQEFREALVRYLDAQVDLAMERCSNGESDAQNP